MEAAVHRDRLWPTWCAYKVGALPLALFLPLLLTVSGLTLTHTLSGDACAMIASITVGGFACAWIGGLIPLLRRLGGPAIAAAFLPSYLVYRHWLPDNFIQTVSIFTRQTNFIYLYIAAIIVGSIFGLDRKMLLRGMAKIFVPLLGGSLVALLLGSIVGVSLGLPLRLSIPMVMVPIMAGGVGEGAIPLSMGYGEIFHQSSADILSHLLPIVLFANLIAIVLAGLLNAAGKRFPKLTGNGLLEKSTQPAPYPSTMVPSSKPSVQRKPFTGEQCLIALLFAILLYLAGVLLHCISPLPPPVTMLLLAVVLKVLRLLPAWLESMLSAVARFVAMAGTFPLLFAVAIALTPWSAVREALQPTNLVLVIVVVISLTLTGFVVGRWLNLFPIEAALVNACHTGSGGTGDVAILMAAERLELMPFAQVATRIGGAITVTVTILILRRLAHGR